ncbi:conserved hypothetical protein [Treponema primitia ZAS-2]|uniref:Transposase (putative) YhgA-like domain-containing protein n=1 Tax=Treponema primitia (strain ATCC BAA-887 / DSM 12427 / ZAS-2) TaxID=545694 RepID=F5YK93_TREPZ|nr:hypothetical protein [Treponema primitia]AEF85045.1 conserved hypothetical protein [Treponema primitia ZAS-2]
MYKTSLVKIPKPEFIVFYNGPGETPEKWKLWLSDAFIGLEPGEKVPLDLIVTVYNINPGHNEGMLEKCEELSGYSIFVDKVREYKKTISDKDIAFRQAINDCIEHNILREFLKLHATEVLQMLLTEWNTEEALAFEREEGWKEGREEGEKKKALETAKNLLALGVSLDTVAKAVGLDMETVKSLAQ